MNTEDMFSRWLEKNKEIKNVEQRLEQQLQASADNLSLKEFCLLFHLSEAPEKSMKLHELERLVGLSQSAMSRLVMRLEGRPCSLIERHQCNLDKRNVHVVLTECGQAALTRSFVIVRSVLATQATYYCEYSFL